jgi:hypothetical protein
MTEQIVVMKGWEGFVIDYNYHIVYIVNYIMRLYMGQG